MNKNLLLFILAGGGAIALYYYMKNKKDAEIQSIPEPVSAPRPVANTNKSLPVSGTKAGQLDRYKLLKLGVKGPEVYALQNYLKPWSFNKIVSDGNFGKATESYLMSYKQNKNLISDPKSTTIAELNIDGKNNIMGL